MSSTPGRWEYACDSYGKVRHSKKACVYTNVTGPGGDRIVKVAAQVENWDDARLMAKAPNMLALLKEASLDPIPVGWRAEARALLREIEGEEVVK